MKTRKNPPRPPQLPLPPGRGRLQQMNQQQLAELVALLAQLLLEAAMQREASDDLS